MIDLSAQEECIADYERLKELRGVTPQERGRQFNDLVARALEAHGIPARASQRSERGEIDVSFRMGDKRFILEAKWEQGPVSIDPIAKLGLRIDQRIPNNMGILLSMNGFTSDAVRQMGQAGRPYVLLLDQNVIEALLYGALEAPVLFDACVDVAAFEGNYHVQLPDIFRFVPRRPGGFEIDEGTGSALSDELTKRLRPQGDISEFTIIKADLPFGQCGVSAGGESVFVTLSDGIYEYGQGRFTKRRGFSAGSPRPAVLVQDLVGKVVEIPADYPAGSAVDACFVSDRAYAVIGSAGLRYYEDGKHKWSVDVLNGASVSLFDGRFFFLENGVHLKSVESSGVNVRSVVRFNLGGSVGDFALLSEKAFYFHLFYPDGQKTKAALVRVKL